jgi:hypothetical protein
LSSCKRNEQNREKNTLSIESRGGFHEIVVVADSLTWTGRPGEALREALYDIIPGLPQPENRFKLIHIYPSALQSFLKLHHNVLFLTSFDNKSTENRRNLARLKPETIEAAKKDPTQFMSLSKNLYANGQQALFVYSPTQEQLANNIRQYQNRLRQHFHDLERERVGTKMYSAQENKKLGKFITNHHPFALRVPMAYKLVKNEENFIWLRFLEQRVDKSIFIVRLPYNNPKVFELEQFVSLRDSLGFQYFNDGKRAILPDSYIITENDNMEVEATKLNFNGLYAVEYRGLWLLKNQSRGGPFLGYLMVDKSNKELYYIEGFIDAPGEDKRAHIVELETIIRTFVLQEQAQKAS